MLKESFTEKGNSLLPLKDMFILIPLVLFSFNNISAQYPEGPLVPARKGELYGYIDSISRKVVIPYKYKPADRFIIGLAVTKNKKGLEGIIDIKGKYQF